MMNGAVSSSTRTTFHQIREYGVLLSAQRQELPTILILQDAEGPRFEPLMPLLERRRVLRVNDVIEALTVLEHNHLDLIIVDESVDGLRAAELCTSLRACDSNADVPILLLGAPHADYRLAAFAAGADGLIELPLDPPLASAQIDAILRLDRFGARRELSERLASAEQQLSVLKECDSATGLPNAAMFESAVSQELARAQRAEYALGVLVVEFSNYDTLGTLCDQRTLDALMRAMADRLSGAVRGRAVVGRLDARCLVVCQPLPRVDEMTHAVTRYRRVLMDSYVVDDQEYELECSIGGSVFPTDADDAERLIGLAASAMSHARHLGRNKYHLFEPAARADAKRRLELEGQIRRAINADGMLLHYQPCLRLEDGAVTGVEALLRLRDEDGELLSPHVFMSVAEDSGLMEALGIWALRRACEDAAALQAANLNVRVSVNVAGDLLIKESFCDELKTALDDFDINGSCLELEVTERAIQPSRHGSLYALQERMRRIQREGVRFSLDNFGSGQTCLNDLRHVPLDSIKLSQDMITSIPDDERMTAFVQSLLAVGKSLGMRMVAQGVEHPEQMSCLRDMGCDSAQGYLFAHPMALEKLKVTLRGLIDTWESAYGQARAG